MKDPSIQACKRKLYEMYGKFGLYSSFYTFMRLFTAPLFEIEKYVPKSGKILDIGCGSGIFSNLLCLMSQDRSVIGYDMSDKRIQFAKKTVKNCRRLAFYVKDANDVNFNGSYLVTVVDLLHHMPYQNQEGLLNKIYSGIKIPGLLVLKDLEKRPLWKYVFHYIQDSISYRSKLFFRSCWEMEDLLRRIGYRVHHIRQDSWLPYPHILYLCEK